MVFMFEKNNVGELLERLQDDDIVEIRGADLIGLLQDNFTGSRGRKPIEVDASLFDETVARWKQGLITAREAMKTLNLKPNTFYRRIKERSVNDMIDIKHGIDEAKNQLSGLAAEVKPKVEEKKQLLGIKHEIAHGKIEVKLGEVGEKISMRHEVSREAKEYKEANK